MTDLKPLHVCDASLEPAVLQALVAAIPTSDVWHVPRLHAKVYAVDSSRAIVTSGNLPAGAFYRNREYGIEVRDTEMVRTIVNHFDAMRIISAHVSREHSTRYAHAALQLRKAYIQQQKECGYPRCHTAP